MPLKRNYLIVTLVALVIVIVGAIIWFKGKPTDTSTVRIGYLNITASLPLFIAEDKGFFADEGIKFQSLPIATSNQLVDAIAANNLDAFIESSAVPVLAVELQSPGRLKVFSVSAITKKAPFDSLLVKDSSSINKLSDLAGKKIGVFPGSTATTLLKKYLADKGVNTSGVTFTPVPPQNQLTALQSGSIDVLHAYEPTTAIALTHGGVRQIDGSVYAEMLDPNPQGVAVVSNKFLQEHSAIASKLIRALERAMIFMRDHDAESRQIMAKRLGLDKAVADRSVFLYMLPSKEIDPVVFQKYADMLTNLGELKGSVAVNQMLYSH